jgi:hypothetical protein
MTRTLKSTVPSDDARHSQLSAHAPTRVEVFHDGH